jgi:NB-ARC domain
MQSQKRRWFKRPVLIFTIGIIISLVLIFFNGLTVISIFAAVFTVISTLVLIFPQLISALSPDHTQLSAIAPSTRRPRNIMSVIPPTKPKTIQQREGIVKDIYNMLIKDNAAAIVLTGIVGNGKSILAALICSFAEKQRLDNKGLFNADPAWLVIDSETTIADICRTLFEKFGKIEPDYDIETPQRLAAALVSMLKETDQKRLIVLDQFDKILDTQTGHVHALGIAELLDILLSEPCASRILLTSRCWPLGLVEIASSMTNEWHIRGLGNTEAKQLLRDHGLQQIDQAKPEELEKVFSCCNNHPWALTRLAALLKLRNLSLAAFLDDTHSDNMKSWHEELAHHKCDRDLDIIYNQLKLTQRALLRAFSIFRKPVPLDAAQSLINFTTTQIGIKYVSLILITILKKLPQLRLSSQLDVLLRQHLLEPSEKHLGNYLLHPIVASYAQDHFVGSNEEDNGPILQIAHGEAAKFYQRQAKKCPVEEQKQLDIIEHIWHLYKAGRWQKAYQKLSEERIHDQASSQNVYAELRELCLEMLSDNLCKPAQKATLYVKSGRVCEALNTKKEALFYYKLARSNFQTVNDRRNERTVLERMAILYIELGETPDAEECMDEASRLG